MGKKISIRLDQIPRALLDENARCIGKYSTVLLYNNKVIGSGTFLQCGLHFGILTAHHVIGETIGINLRGNGVDKKLVLAIEDNPVRFEIKLQYIRLFEVGKPKAGNYNEYGPDLILLEILDRNKLGTIKAIKSFWNIQSETYLKNELYKDENSVWVVCGLPQDLATYSTSNSNFKKISCEFFPYLTPNIKQRIEKNGFDYFDVSIKCDSKNDFPDTFKGMSGGGLWKVPLSFREGSGAIEDLVFGSPIFAGAIFYQTEKKGDFRILRSHGAKSIYEILPKVLKKS